MNTVISKERYKELLKDYLEEQGPNPGTGMFGRWAWNASKEKEFQKNLAKTVDLPGLSMYNGDIDNEKSPQGHYSSEKNVQPSE